MAENKENKSFCSEKSLFKLKIYLSVDKQKTFYSFLYKDKKNPQESRDGLVNRMLQKYKGQYNIAILYDNQTKNEICRFDEHGNFKIFYKWIDQYS